jgi:hypothetical protein
MVIGPMLAQPVRAHAINGPAIARASERIKMSPVENDQKIAKPTIADLMHLKITLLHLSQTDKRGRRATNRRILVPH